MGSGVLLAALVVLWFVVLVPMVVTRGAASTARAEVTRGRTLQRRRAGDPVASVATERVSVDRGPLRRSGELRGGGHAGRRRRGAGGPVGGVGDRAGVGRPRHAAPQR